jgi:ribosomal protein S15P/S13E
LDSVLKQFLGNSVKADSTAKGFANVTPPVKKKDNNDVAKLIDNINDVNNHFGDHFDDQQKRFADLK